MRFLADFEGTAVQAVTINTAGDKVPDVLRFVDGELWFRVCCRPSVAGPARELYRPAVVENLPFGIDRLDR